MINACEAKVVFITKVLHLFMFHLKLKDEK